MYEDLQTISMVTDTSHVQLQKWQCFFAISFSCTRWCPESIAKLVNITPITMVYRWYIDSIQLRKVSVPMIFQKAPIYRLPGLVNVNKKRWKDPPCLMGKSTISIAMASIAFCMFTRGYFPATCIHVWFLEGTQGLMEISMGVPLRNGGDVTIIRNGNFNRLWQMRCTLYKTCTSPNWRIESLEPLNSEGFIIDIGIPDFRFAWEYGSIQYRMVNHHFLHENCDFMW